MVRSSHGIYINKYLTFQRHLLRTIHSISDKTHDINDEKSVRENFARLEVFFDELNYAVTKEVPAYPVS